MQISKIAVKNVKGIQHVEMCPVKPINVLIGRNNSGKSSVLGSLRLLTEYFDTLKDGRVVQPPAYRIPAEFIRRGGDQDDGLRIIVTARQGVDERREQFLRAVNEWNTQYERPKMDVDRVDRQLEMSLFEEIAFVFGARPPHGQYGLESITTTSPDAPQGTDVVVASTKVPGQSLKRIKLRSLFQRAVHEKCETIYDVVSRHGLVNDVDIRVTPTGLDCPEPIFVHHLIQPAFEFLRRCFASISTLDAYRHGEVRAAAQKCESLPANGVGLVPFVHNLILNNHALFTEIAELVKCISPEVGRLHARFASEQDHSIELAYEWPDGRVVNLANMGGGVEQLVILGCLLVAQKTTCILWEEPESHLHPGAQDALLSELESRMGESHIFITTHSPVFVRPSDKIAVHAITNPDGKSATGRTLLKEGLQEACMVLGSRPGHLAQADIVLYVEGKHGAAVFEEWLYKWPEREAILGHLLLVVQPCNPDEMGTDDFDLRTLKTLTPNMIMFVDRDNDMGSSDPKECRKKLMIMCGECDIPCVVTDRRQIEDYFSEGAVKAALPKNLLSTWKHDATKPMGEQLQKGWKKHNRRIAEMMSWPDIHKNHDIMRVFTTIENYAKQLKP